MAPAVHRLHKSDVSCEPRTAGIIGNAIDADVDHDGAGLDPCATDHLVTAYRRHQYVRGRTSAGRSRVFEWATVTVQPSLSSS